MSPNRSIRIPTPILGLASFLYGLGARVHRFQATRLRGARGRPGCAVLSVGGLTVGGAGKTPVAAAIARGLNLRGRRVVIASRGYRGASRERVTVVSDGRNVLSPVKLTGDESLILAAHAPGVPVLIGRDRRVVGHHAVSYFDAEVLVLDDGFQHHRLARDLDIVCIDGFSGLGNHHVLPRGPLREPISAINFADWLCVVDGGADERDAEVVASFARGGGRILRARRAPNRLVSLDRRYRIPAKTLAGTRVGLIAGVARPASIRRTLEALGATVESERVFPDHHAYRESDLAGLGGDGLHWITTEKDALKILPSWIGNAKLSVLEIEIEFDDELEVFESIESHLFS